MARNLFIWAAVIVSLMLLCSPLTWGQATTTSSLQGTVADKSEAVISKAEVTITNKATGATHSTSTNGVGEYKFDPVAVGIYDVTVKASGFSTAAAKFSDEMSTARS